MIETGWNEAKFPVVFNSGPVERLTVQIRRERLRPASHS